MRTVIGWAVIFLYWVVNISFLLALGLWSIIFFVLLYNLSVYRPHQNPEDLFLVLTGLTIVSVCIGLIRGALLRTFEVRKHLSLRRYKQTVENLRKSAEKERQSLSQQSDERNITPLVDLTQKELHLRHRDVTPNNFENTNRIIAKYRAENAVVPVAKLHELIVNTPPPHLNKALEDYLDRTGGK